jgi:hypothetical protein
MSCRLLKTESDDLNYIVHIFNINRQLSAIKKLNFSHIISFLALNHIYFGKSVGILTEYSNINDWFQK